MASPLNLIFDKTPDNKIQQYKVISSKNVASMFNNAQFSPFPSSVDTQTGNVSKIKTAFDIHKDDIYDTSITSLVEYTNHYPSMKLDYADFAYLKNVGVFPNNRLLIARRFAGGVPNDLIPIKTPPIATLISWVPDGTDFISVDYSEKWVDAESSFVDVLNNIGKDVQGSQDQGTKYGSSAAGAFGAIPLPGFMEGLQYQVLENMGFKDKASGLSPLGNPNLIRSAKRRDTLNADTPGSGLEASFTVKMVVEYEQKFINGVDPTLVYLDIIQNALSFGTSDAVFQFNSAFADGANGFIKNLISGDIGAIAKALTDLIKAFTDAVNAVSDKLLAGISDSKDTTKPSENSVFDSIKTLFASTIGNVINKYKVRLIGVANALTGSPSTPWHITIGNPKKPIFTSGDMLCKDVSITTGKNLGFNDLPSYIKIEFTLTNARPLGAQEIFNRFNSGIGRSYARFQKSFVDAPIDQSTSNNKSNAATNNDKINSKDDYFLTGKSVGWFDLPNNNSPVNMSNSQVNTNGVKVDNSNVTNSFIGPSNQSTSTIPNSTVTNITPTGGASTPTQDPITSQLGYTYTVAKDGPKSQVFVTDTDGYEVYTGNPSYTKSADVLIQEAKVTLGDK